MRIDFGGFKRGVFEILEAQVVRGKKGRRERAELSRV
jgi:hypothetical protein